MPPKRKAAGAVAAAEVGETPVESPAVAEETTAITTPNDVSAAAATNEEPTPAIVVAGTPTEMYAQLQAVVALDPARINDHVGPVLELMQAAEDPVSPILLRVRFLEFIGRTVANLRDNNALKKIVTSLVKVIGGENNTPQLLIAALQCFPGLGPVSMLDKRWEYLSREGADILMQVIVDREAFAEPVRHAARSALDLLTSTAFRSVVTKLVHWLSDEREDDDAEQIQRERHLALSTLGRLALGHSHRAQWTEDTETYVVSLIYRILGIVDAREFAQLARIAAHLPSVQARHGLPLLESFLGENKLDSERSIEAVSILGRFTSTAPRRDETASEPVEFDLVAPMEAAGLLAPGAVEGEGRRGMLIARVQLLAARLAPADAAERLLPATIATVRSLVHKDDAAEAALPENLSTLEAALFAAVAIAKKKPAEMLQILSGEEFGAAMSATAAAAAALEPELAYAIKKRVRDSKADADDAEALACVHNIHTIAGSFAAKHVPMGDIKESWTGKAKLPVLKRSRDIAKLGLPPAPGTAAANDRARLASHVDPTSRGGNRARSRGGHGSNSGNNSNKSGSHKREQSSGSQPHKKRRTSSSGRGGGFRLRN